MSNDPTGKKIVYVSEGGGKTITNTEKSTAGIGFIDIDRKLLLAQMTISTRDIDSSDAIPTGLAVTANEWAFVTLRNGLVSVDTREYKTYATISKTIFSGIVYNDRRREVLAVKDNEIYILNDNSGLVQRVLQSDQQLKFVFPQ